MPLIHNSAKFPSQTKQTSNPATANSLLPPSCYLHLGMETDAPQTSTFTPVQALVVASLAQGKSISAAARAADVHRTTIHHWFRTLPAFNQAARQACAEYADAQRDQLMEMGPLALSRVRSLLEDPGTANAVQLRAALAVLDRINTFSQPSQLAPKEASSESDHPKSEEELRAGFADLRRRLSQHAKTRTTSQAAEPADPNQTDAIQHNSSLPTLIKGGRA